MALKLIIMVRENLMNRITFFIIAIIMYSCGPMFGTYNLGDGFYLMLGDKDSDRIIVYNDHYKHASDVVSGKNIIPSYEYWISDILDHPYVQNIKYNSRWIIATTSHKDTIYYWALDKTLPVSRCVTGPLSKSEYMQFLHDSDIEGEHFKYYGRKW